MVKDNIIFCVCLTCGARNTSSNETSFCPERHDDWLEYRDFNAPEMTFVIDRAEKIFGMKKSKLFKEFKKGKQMLINNNGNSKRKRSNGHIHGVHES